MLESIPRESDPLPADSSWLLESVFRRSDLVRVFGGSFRKGETEIHITKDFADGEDRYWITLTNTAGFSTEFRLFEEDLCLVGPVWEKIYLRPEDVEPIKRLALPK
jgi:hypothetical protein